MSQGRFSSELRVLCPYCRNSFAKSHTVPLSRWQLLAKNAFGTIQVKCIRDNEAENEAENEEAQDCGFVGTLPAFRLHKHYDCPNRIIACPGRSCGVRGTVSRVKTHFEQHCEHVAVYCRICCLPVRCRDESTHDCVDSLKNCVRSKYY
jgi:hypothetical protein